MGLAAWGQTVPCAAWTAENDQAESAFAAAVSSAGDVNGDGHGDVLVGAPFFERGEAFEGRAYLYLGSPVGLATGPAWSAESDQPGAFFGNSVASAGDVNGDGFSDVIVGVSRFENGQVFEGAAHVYLGSAVGLGATPAWTVEGDSPRAFFGNAVASAGDVNGDGFDDVIIGAYLFSNDQEREGRAYVYLGSAAGLSPTPAWFVESDQTDSQFGNSVGTAGDVNGDGYSDVIVGAPYITHPEIFEGRVYVYLGSSTGLATTPAWIAEGNRSPALLGISAGTAGDVNGDGFSDVIVGAQTFAGGAAFAYLGSAAGLEASPAWSVEAQQLNAALGNSVATAGDVNGDGFSDVIVGAFQYSLPGQPLEGRALVYLGSSSGLATEPAWKADGHQADAQFGGAVSGAGDVNGDGYSDVIVGAYMFDGGQSNEGRASVYLGSALGLSRTFVFPGDHINVDTIEPVDVILGSTWSAPLRIGHPHGRQGLLMLSVRSTTMNGANVVSPIGGRSTETLISGPLFATIRGSTFGFSGDIPPQAIPSLPSLLGLGWAAQYTVVGGGFADLSQAVYGVVSACQ